MNVSDHHLEVTNSIRNNVSTKQGRLARHFGRVTDINVTLSAENQRQKSELNVHLRGEGIYAASNYKSLWAAVDQLADKLDRQVVKRKEKTKERKNGADVR